MAARNGIVAATGAALATMIVALTGTATAAPPLPGTTHTFRDPIFDGTVVCDTIEQIRDIATADEPDDVYGFYRVTTNALDEPTCMAIVPTGVVLDVTRIGVMEKDGGRYNAWAVETEIKGVVVYALYLERIAGLSA